MASEVTGWLKRIWLQGETGATNTNQVETILTGGTQTTQIINSDGSQVDIGINGGCIDAVLSDTVNLLHPGYFEPRLIGGDIKYTDLYGNVGIMTFDKKELSRFKVNKIWLTGTTAAMGIKIYYK